MFPRTKPLRASFSSTPQSAPPTSGRHHQPSPLPPTTTTTTNDPIIVESLDLNQQVEMFFPDLLLNSIRGGGGMDGDDDYDAMLNEQEEEDSDWEEEDARQQQRSRRRHSSHSNGAGGQDYDDATQEALSMMMMNSAAGEDEEDYDHDDEEDYDHDDEARGIGESEDFANDSSGYPQDPSSSSMHFNTHNNNNNNSTSNNASKTANFAARTRNTFLKIGGFVKRELNKARKSSGVNKRRYARVFVRRKQVQELVNVTCVQRIEAHTGAIWCMEFSNSNLLATGGVDSKICVWLCNTAISQGEESTTEQQDNEGLLLQEKDCVAGVQVIPSPLVHSKPLRVLVGHVGDVLALAWSRSHFLASSSVDKTVRVWFPTTTDACLCVLKHPDFVTGVDFHPVDDSLVLTACFDKQVRLWDVTTGTCTQRLQTPSFLTSCKFNLTGDFAVAGLYTGHCVFYQMIPVFGGKSMAMRYFTQIECRNKTGIQKKGRKVTRIRFLYIGNQEHMLVTTNESRSRLYNMDDFSLKCKYRGSLNSMLQIGASCSDDGRHIICGSEDRHVVVWRTKNDLVKSLFGRPGKKLLCDAYESFRATDTGPVTVAQFAPDCLLVRRKTEQSSVQSTPIAAATTGEENQETIQAEDMVGLRGALILTAGFDGVVGIFDSQ